ncbi:hypothetical protein CR513_05606, partial [Mucuna pruriens]
MGKHEDDVPIKILPCIQNNNNQERNMWHEATHWFNKLCLICPHHQINKQLLIQYVYEGLILMDKSMIDVLEVEL